MVIWCVADSEPITALKHTQHTPASQRFASTDTVLLFKCSASSDTRGRCISELCHFRVAAFKHRTARQKCHLILGSSFCVSWAPFWELRTVRVVSPGNHPSSSVCKDGCLEMLYPCFAAWLAPRAVPGPCHFVIPHAQQSRQSSSCQERGQSHRDGAAWSRAAQSLAASACTSSHMGFPPVLLPPSVLTPPRVVPWSSCVPRAQCCEHLVLFLVFWAEEHQNNNFWNPCEYHLGPSWESSHVCMWWDPECASLREQEESSTEYCPHFRWPEIVWGLVQVWSFAAITPPSTPQNAGSVGISAGWAGVTQPKLQLLYRTHFLWVQGQAQTGYAL